MDGWLSDEWELPLSFLEYHHTLMNCFLRAAMEVLWLGIAEEEVLPWLVVASARKLY